MLGRHFSPQGFILLLYRRKRREEDIESTGSIHKRYLERRNTDLISLVMCYSTVSYTGHRTSYERAETLRIKIQRVPHISCRKNVFFGDRFQDGTEHKKARSCERAWQHRQVVRTDYVSAARYNSSGRASRGRGPKSGMPGGVFFSSSSAVWTAASSCRS